MAGSISMFGGSDFILRPDKEEIYDWLGVREELPAHVAYEAAWEEALVLFKGAADIRCCIFVENRQAATVFFTLGGKAEHEVEAAFSRGDYVLGSLINSMADQAVFRSDLRTGMLLSDTLAEEGLYAARRMEAPFDYPLNTQTALFEPMRSSLPAVRALPSGLFTPAKSLMYRMALSAQPADVMPQHDCARCNQKNCPYRGLRG